MSASASTVTPPRHPWLARFQQSPATEFGEFLAGYADIHPYERADRSDAAFMLFAPLPADDAARQALGPAILEWLDQRNREKIPAAHPPWQRFIREVCDAFEIVAALELESVANRLRHGFARWNDWVAALVLSPARDARAAYWRMLAATQPLLGQSGESLMPFWLQICREAGGALPRHYLNIGLLGLRRLPNPGPRADAPWLAGLAHWALAQNPGDAAFRAEWLALKPLYPGRPETWRRMVDELLSARMFREAGITAPGWWEVDADFTPMARPNYQHRAPLQAPTRVEAEALRNRFGEPFMVVEREIATLMDRHRRFRDQTGQSRFFVRVAHMLGQALLTGGDAPEQRAVCAEALAREGLDWEPGNRHLRALWRDALAGMGTLEPAELVGWDFIRRAPDDAEPRTQLAELLIERDHLAEAEAAVEATFAAGIADEAAYALRARLLSHRGEVAAAHAVVEEGVARWPGNSVLRLYREILEAGGSLRLRRAGGTSMRPMPHATAFEPGPMLATAMRYGRLRRLRFRLDSDDAATQEAARVEFAQLPAEDRHTAYAGLLITRYRIGGPDQDALPGFASAFERALADEDQVRLQGLTQEFPRLEALTLLARAILGDAVAAAEVAHWVQNAAPASEPVAMAGLRATLRPLLSVIQGGGELLSAARPMLVLIAREANEANIDDLFGQLAA